MAACHAGRSHNHPADPFAGDRSQVVVAGRSPLACAPGIWGRKSAGRSVLWSTWGCLTDMRRAAGASVRSHRERSGERARDKAGKTHMKFQQNRKDLQTHPKVHGTTANTRPASLGKISPPPPPNASTLPPRSRINRPVPSTPRPPRGGRGGRLGLARSGRRAESSLPVL